MRNPKLTMTLLFFFCNTWMFAQSTPDSIRSLPAWKQKRLEYGLPVFEEKKPKEQKDTIGYLPVWQQVRLERGLPVIGLDIASKYAEEQRSKRDRQQKRKQRNERNYAHWQENRQGSTDLLLSFPWLNVHRIHPPGVKYSLTEAGFWGIGLGLEHFVSNSTSIIFRLNQVHSFMTPIPIPACDDYFTHTHLFSTDISITRNHYFDQLSAGYGVGVVRYDWRYCYIDGSSGGRHSNLAHRYGKEDMRKAYYSVALPMYLQWHVVKGFSLGISYRPTYHRLKASHSRNYEHLVSLDMQFRIKAF